MRNENLQEKFQAFVTNSSEGIWLCEVTEPIPTKLPAEAQIALMYEHGYLAEANDAMAQMYAVKSGSDLVGLRLGDLLVQENPKNTEYLKAFVESGYRLSGVESHERDQDGNDRIFRNSLVGIVEGGKLLRAWGTQQDVTDQYKMTQALKQSEARLALALKVSKMGMWEWDLESDKLEWSDELKALFGLEAHEEITFEKYQALLHPKDRAMINKKIRAAMKTGEEYQIEHRAVWRDGSIHWILGQGRAILSKGKPVVMIGTSVSLDDTKRKDELEKINIRLNEQKQRLVELNQVKDEFIALASHQLRTPATAVKQYTHMLLDGYYGELSSSQRTAVKVAVDSNERQLKIINDLLRVAQLDAGKVVLQKRLINVAALVKKVVEEQHGKFADKEQVINVECGKSTLPAHVDEARMRMAIENLIDNAHKYTAPGKSVTVKVVQNKVRILISIIDQGIGIRKADLPKLFQKFSRLGHTLGGEVTGSGLGLYWAYQIVNLHGGTITVESVARKGSMFVISLPNR